jgi:prepilin-type N-terminal cleavage/methylation domain-containing protein
MSWRTHSIDAGAANEPPLAFRLRRFHGQERRPGNFDCAAVNRSGFTLVELLVVIAIIGVLVALLLPAVQAARSAARRLQCQSNLRNLALAVLNYESAAKAFPPGFVTQPRNEESWGWTNFVLPHLEQQQLYDALGVGERRLADLFIAAGNDLGAPEIKLVQTPLAIYRCPEDNLPLLLPADISGIKEQYPVIGGNNARHFNGNNTPPGFEPAASSYIGMKGFFDNPWCDESGARYTMAQVCANNGVLFADSEVQLAQITDGTSNTFMIGERHLRCLAGTWIGARNPPGPDMYSSYYVLGRASLKINHPTTGSHNSCTEGFSSAHPGGVYFASCDGSVRWVDEQIGFNNGTNRFSGVNAIRGLDLRNPQELGVFQRLAIRNDGQTVAAP